MRENLHVPVLGLSGVHPNVFDILEPKPGETVVDCTLGLAGHAKQFVTLIGPEGHLYGIDADKENLNLASKELEPWEHQVHLLHANFRTLDELHIPDADILFADLGVSSVHFDDSTRGFSFRASGPLDMRLDRSIGKSASEFLHEAREEDIKRVLRDYGELREAGKLAHALWQEGRKSTPSKPTLQTTEDLTNITNTLFGYRAPSLLPQVFQALRIAVNDELGSLEALLQYAKTHLTIGGRLGIISFHSLEDRIVKHTFKEWMKIEKDELTGQPLHEPDFEVLTKHPVEPSQEETRQNPRARSALLRVIRRLR